MTSNSRQTRGGLLEAATIAEANKSAMPKTFLDKWVEPALRAPAPSFMDLPHLSIERHGVLENMAPLGTLPSSKLQKKTATPKPDANTSRRITTSKKPESAASTPPRDIVTPEPVPNFSRRRSESLRRMDEEEFIPHTPVGQTSGHKSSARTGLPLTQPQLHMSMSMSPSKEDQHLYRTDAVIDAACDEAIHAGKYPTAYAIRTLYNDHRSNPRIVKLFESVYQQRADVAELDEFRSLMKYKKKEGAKDDKASKYFDEHDNIYTPAAYFSSNYTVMSPSKRVASDAPVPHKETGHVSKRHKANHSPPHVSLSYEMNGNGNGKINHGTPTRTRSKSVSSCSSLSSLDEELLGESFGAPSPKSRGQVHSAENSVRNHTEPMTQPKAPAPKVHVFHTTNSNTSSSSSTKPSQHNMPIYSEPLPLNQQQPNQTNVKSHKKKDSGVIRTAPDDDLARDKRAARAITENKQSVRDSFVRIPFQPRELESESKRSRSISVATRPTRQILRFRSRKNNDELDEQSSPTLLSFTPELAPDSSSNSRASTPNPNSRPSRKAKNTGPRMKTSPVKKGAGTSAGIPRASGERNSPVGNGTSGHNPDDNDDYCSSCGGNGDLVCCDGCTRSFHLRCVDPPMVDGQLPDEWFCNACVSMRHPPSISEYGLFGLLLVNLEKKNPSAFHLPKDVREYFEGVRTGAEGEYEEGAASKSKNRAGWDEAPDYLKLKDSKGNFILCHNCQEGAGDRHPMITCGYCSLHWHLDCLDPPLANPPAPTRPWRCPCHVDDLLAKVPRTLGPAHRFRRIKGASVIKPAISRGIKNNGHIEVDLSPSDEDEDEGFFDQKEYGHIYKMPEEGIKLDFISRVRSSVAAAAYSTPPLSDIEAPNNHTQHNFTSGDRYSLQEQQAALNLAQLAAQAQSSGAQVLVDALMMEATPEVITMIALGDASEFANSTINSTNKQALLAMKAMIEASLEKMEKSGESADKTDATDILDDRPMKKPKIEHEGEDEKIDDVEMLLE